MEFRTLKYFLTVATEESITNAAKILHITQPTLSRQMNDLEQELGTSLFIRTNRNTLLTNEGILLKQRAQDIISLIEKTEHEFQHTPKEIYGNINIGSVETDVMHIIINSISSLNKRYPNIKYNFYNGNSDELMERLDCGLLDFCLLFGRINEEKYDYLQIPSKDIAGIITHKDSPFAGLKGVTTKELKEMPLLIPSRFSSTVFPLDGHPGEYLDFKSFNVLGTFNQIYNAMLMVKSGICNAISIGSPININNDSELCFVPFSPMITATPFIIWKKQQIISKAEQIFLSELKSDIQAL